MDNISACPVRQITQCTHSRQSSLPTHRPAKPATDGVLTKARRSKLSVSTANGELTLLVECTEHLRCGMLCFACWWFCSKTSWTSKCTVQGTNGGVTLTGLAASLGGGLFMGLVFWSMGAVSPTLYTVPFQQEPAIGQWSLILLGRATFCM